MMEPYCADIEKWVLKRILNEIRDLTDNQYSCCKTRVIGEYFLVPVISLAAEFWMIWSFPSWESGMLYKRLLQ